jgi:DNA polymerase III delta subunit
MGGLYLFLGPDRDRKRARLATLVKTLRVDPLDRHDVSAHELSPSRLLALARQHPAASPVRLVVIHDAHRLDGACLKVFTEQLSVLTQVACLVFLVDAELPVEHPLMRLASSASIERFAGRPVPTPKSPFALVEAMTQRDVATALQALQEQLASGKDVLELLGLLVWQVQRWLTVSHLVEAGVARERIESLTGIRPWQLQRTMAELADWSPALLRRALRRCWELDVAAKTGRTSPRVALEELIVELCLPRPFGVSCQ